jgi:anti-anti-sigma factor
MHEGMTMIRACIEPHVVTFDVAGPATIVESAAVCESATDLIAHGIRSVRVDLRDCTTMDSTFSGTLLSLKRQLAVVGGALTLVSPSRRVLELLRQMGVEDFYTIEVGDRCPGTWKDIPLARPELGELRRLVLDAHAELAHVPGARAQDFRVVVDELRSDSTPHVTQH